MPHTLLRAYESRRAAPGRSALEARVTASLGGGTFAYEGLQSFENPLVTAWRLKLYGGLVLGGDDPTVRSNVIGVMTGPVRVKERADLRLKWLEGRGAG